MFHSITKTFYELLLIEVITRKNHFRSRPGSATSGVAPTCDGQPSTSRNVAKGSRTFTCFAPPGSNHKHTKAASLKDHGVWLGDCNDENEVSHVIEKLFADIKNGSHPNSGDGPIVNARLSLDSDKRMWCVACSAVGRETAPDVIAKNVKFAHKSGKKTVSTTMKKTIKRPLTLFRSGTSLVPSVTARFLPF